MRINKKVACIVLNRNLGKITDKLVLKLKNSHTDLDVFVVDSGSEEKNKSKFTTWHVDTPMVKEFGLRFGQGMNFGLYQLFITKKLQEYDFIFLITNDVIIRTKNFTTKILKIMLNNPAIGLLSPCGSNWGERLLLKKKTLKFFWFIHNNFYVFRKECLFELLNMGANYKKFLYDGDNFRGFMIESEIIAKCYLASWAAAVTNEVIVDENESFLIEKSDLIKTDPFEQNMQKGIKEGEKWIKQKYGFSNPWQMHFYVKYCYDNYFKLFPNNLRYKI